MQGRFAHISDSHIGAWRDQKLRAMNDEAFARAIDICIEKEVDFVVISGDIFDIGIPEMSSVRSAVRKLKSLGDHDISTYVVYGSHDYSPTTVSVVEVLTSAGLFTNVGEFEEVREEGSKKRLFLKPVVDERTGTVIAGLPARRGGLEKSFYEQLEHEAETPDRYSVFVFHASVNELQSLNLPVEQNVSLEDLPKGFSYYAGGHIHKRAEGSIEGSPAVYPGPLFGTSYPDLEMTAKGEKRGFAIVEFDGSKTTALNFIDLSGPRILARAFSSEGKTSEQVSAELQEFSTNATHDVSNAVVLLRVKGVLSSGKASDIDWFSHKLAILKRGAAVVNISRSGVTTKEARKLDLLAAASKEEIESKLLEQHIKEFKTESPDLKTLSSEDGIARASKLLRALKTEKKDEETKKDFETRVWKEASQILGFTSEETRR